MVKANRISLSNWSTPLVIGAYLVTAISGVMLFFHVGESLIKEAHEWIGLIFVFGALLHIKNHWLPLKKHFTRPVAQTVIASVLIAGAAFVVVSGNEGVGNPVRAVMHSMEQAPLSLVAQLQQRDEAELVRLLENAGFMVTDPGASLQKLAEVNNTSSREIIPLLFRDR